MYAWLEYVFVTIKAVCIGMMMTLGLTYKWKETKNSTFFVILMTGLLLSVYILVRVVMSGTIWISCYVSFTAVIIVYGILGFQDSIVRKLAFSLVVALLTALCEYVGDVVFALYLGHADFYTETLKEYPSAELVVLSVDITIQLIVHGIFIAVWNRILNIRKYAKYNIVLYLIFPLSQFTIVFFLNGKAAYIRLLGNIYSVVGMIIGYMADMFFYYMLLNQERRKELQTRYEETRRLHEIEKVHYDSLESGKKQIDNLKREFNGQLTAIVDSWENGNGAQADILFHKLKKDVAATKEYEYCSNAVVNAVLMEKEKQAESYGIHMDINLSAAREISVSAMHMCSVFSNLLDNAIHATAAYSGEKIIRVRSGYVGDYFFVNVENRCEKPGKKNMQNGCGYGLEILKDIAKEYGGTFSGNWKDEMYVARIMLTVNYA